MTDRITEIKASELTLEHLFLSAEVIGQRASSIEDSAYVGQILRFKTRPNSIRVIFGPAQGPIELYLHPDSLVKILDAPRPDRELMNFGAQT